VLYLPSGLSGCTPEQINAVDPQFIQAAKISQTLTPGRNNGFLNMLAVMKKKAMEAAEKGSSGAVGGDSVDATAANGDAAEEVNGDAAERDNDNIVTTFDAIDGKPMYNAILSTLIPILKPTSITLTDNSSQHAGHAGNKGWEESGESHFALDIVSDAFDGLNLVKRHQLIYMLLGEVMPKIHALEIRAKSTSEVE
jgi:stress-induced morphogen